MECELLRSPMISYRSLLYNTTVLYDREQQRDDIRPSSLLSLSRSLLLLSFFIRLYVRCLCLPSRHATLHDDVPSTTD